MTAFVRSVLVVAMIFVAACTVEKKENAALTDTPASTVAAPLPAPAAALPAPPPAVNPQPASSNKPPAKSKSKTPTAGGERDSAVQPIMGIDSTGKIKRVKG